MTLELDSSIRGSAAMAATPIPAHTKNTQTQRMTGFMSLLLDRHRRLKTDHSLATKMIPIVGILNIATPRPVLIHGMVRKHAPPSSGLAAKPSLRMTMWRHREQNHQR
jgi:hypothetical protein